jgi:CheY-like chemotaxis protein
LELARSKSFALPGMNGVEVHQRVRQLQTDTVGILVPAFAGQDTVNDASATGMHRVLPKPVDFDQLLPLLEVGRPGPRCG